MRPVSTVGCAFVGYCSACETGTSGIITTGAFATINGMPIAVSGSIAVGYCGCVGIVTGTSRVFRINGIPVARVGDPVFGTVQGVITSGTFVLSD